MKTKALALMPAVLASPALAHGGAHLHPHGVEGWTIGLGLLALVLAGALVYWTRR